MSRQYEVLMSDLKALKGKYVLVTGGAGFIGSNLCEALLSVDCKVRCLDNLATGRMQNINTLMEQKDFEFMRGDIRKPEDCAKAVKGVSIVFHQAALGSVPRSIDDPRSTHEVNVDGFMNMLLACKEAGIKRFIYASSSSVYGDSAELPKREENIGRPLSPYAVSKVSNEQYAQIFHKVYGLETIGLRYFNVFGKHQDPEGAYAAAIPKFIKAFIRHESPVIHGDGTHSRDFTYVQNVVAMNLLAAATNNSKAFGEVFNTAVGDRFDLNSMVIILRDCLAKYDPAISRVQLKYGPERPGDIPHSLASIEKAKSILQYEPKYGFESGIQEAIDWYWQDLS